MIPAYHLTIRRLELIDAARSWLGTPFRKGAAIKGAGADCVHLAHEVYAASGFQLPPIATEYSLDAARHLKLSKLIQWIEASARFSSLSSPLSSVPGDLLLFTIGRIEHHVGIQITASTFINAIKRHGVCELNLHDSTWAKRLSAVYRPMEEALA